MNGAAMIRRHLAAVAMSVTSGLAVTTCDIQANPATLTNESGEDGLNFQIMSSPTHVTSERLFGESVAFPGTRSGGCVEHSWGWRIADNKGTVLVERSFEQDPICSGDTLIYEGNGIVREGD